MYSDVADCTLQKYHIVPVFSRKIAFGIVNSTYILDLTAMLRILKGQKFLKIGSKPVGVELG